LHYIVVRSAEYRPTVRKQLYCCITGTLDCHSFETFLPW